MVVIVVLRFILGTVVHVHCMHRARGSPIYVYGRESTSYMYTPVYRALHTRSSKSADRPPQNATAAERGKTKLSGLGGGRRNFRGFRQGTDRGHVHLQWHTAKGWLREHMGHLRYRWVKKIGRTRASAARGCANAAPAAMPPPTEASRERAALALWATPVHASSMVESTAEDHLTLDGDANVCRRR